MSEHAEVTQEHRDAAKSIGSQWLVYGDWAAAQLLADWSAELERAIAVREWMAAPVHAWPDEITYPQEWGAELVRHRNKRIRDLSDYGHVGLATPAEGKR